MIVKFIFVATEHIVRFARTLIVSDGVVYWLLAALAMRAFEEYVATKPLFILCV